MGVGAGTIGSNQQAKHSLTALICFRSFYCYYVANSFVSGFPHIDFFDTVYDIIFCAHFLIKSSKRFGYIVVTILITITYIF